MNLSDLDFVSTMSSFLCSPNIPAITLFGRLIRILILAQCAIEQSPIKYRWPKDYGPKALHEGNRRLLVRKHFSLLRTIVSGLEEYDFVIVGAGRVKARTKVLVSVYR